MKLWINYNTGDVTCVDHAGVSLTAGINANGRSVQETPFGTYELAACDIPCMTCHFGS